MHPAHSAHKKTAAVMMAIEKKGSAINHSKNHQADKTTLKTIVSHPTTLIGIGFALGYLTYRFLSSIVCLLSKYKRLSHS